MARFSCASFSQKSSTFMFHGDPRVWDGATIKKTVKGDSVLYVILEDDQVCLCHLTQCIMLGVCSHAELRPFKHEFFCVTQSRKLLFFIWIYIYIFVGQLRNLLVFKVFPSAGYMMRTVENVFYSHAHKKIMYPIMPTVLQEGFLSAVWEINILF